MKTEGRRWTTLFGVAIVACSFAGLAATTAEAAPQYTLDCSSCHTMPPTDSAIGKKDPTNGAIPGRHQTHAGSSAASCATCHGDVSAYGTSHRDGVIQFSDSLGYSRKVAGVFMNQTSVTSTTASCSTAACHSDGTTNRTTPAWSSTSPATCSTCHDSEPSSNAHGMHITTYGFGCVKCHSDHSAENKPFQHATSAGKRGIDVHFTAAPNNGNGNFEGVGNGQCSNLYCHSNGQGVSKTIAWDATTNCNSCHGVATSTLNPLSGKHKSHVNNAAVIGDNFGCAKCHADTVSSNGSIADFGKHVNGIKEVSAACTTCHNDGKGTNVKIGQNDISSADWSTAPAIGCDGCHGSAASFGAPAYTSEGAGLTKANSHAKHVAAATDCVSCHGTTVNADGVSIKTGGTHLNAAINVAQGGSATLTYSADTKSCSTSSCHSGSGVITAKTAQWGSAPAACNTCHDAQPAAGAHTTHLTKGYTCDSCHSTTAASNTTLVPAGTHMSGALNVAGASITTFNSDVNKSCATACHGSATPKWNDNTTAACGSCHAATSPVIATNGHATHFSATYGPGLSATTNTCATCHTYTGDMAATHVNGTVNLASGFNASGTCGTCHGQSVTWTSSARLACESCHSTANSNTLSVIGGVTAPDKTSSATLGHGKTGIAKACTDCHSNTGSHISGTLGDNNRLQAGLTCNTCHDDAAKVTNPAMQNMRVHQDSGKGSSCSDCHNVHGTTNNMMVNTTINGVAVTFTGNSTFANANGTGVCQACHTNTRYFTSNNTPAPQTHQDSTTDCTQCHKHSPAGGALAFTPNGACDACHGYPPAPRQTLSAVEFGKQGQWSSARFEDYSGGGGAHLVLQHLAKTVRPSDQFEPCKMCHADAAASHTRAMPIRTHVTNVTVKVAGRYRFSNDAFPVYTSATLANDGTNKTGSCFNVACHFQNSPKWSIER